LLFPLQLLYRSADSFIYTNAPTETNIIVQAVFTTVGDPKIQTQARFSPNDVTNNVTTATLEFRVPLTNVVTGSADLFTLYLKDTIAWDTNIVMEYNVNQGHIQTFYLSIKPISSIEWFTGGPSNGELVPELLWNDTFTNTVVTNFYAAYSADVASSSLPPVNSLPIPLEDQAPGRVEITAKSLDLSNLRIRGEGLVSIKTDHLQNTGGAIVDVENTSFTLASTNSVLNIDELAVPNVSRFSGNIAAYSAIWTNLTGIIVTNPPADADSEETFTTNVVTYLFHVMMVDATGLRTVSDVLTHDFNAKAENIRIADDFQVIRSFVLEGENVTIDSNIDLFLRASNVGATNFVNLLNFTNQGSFSINEVAQFGTDRTNQLNRFINKGSLNAFSQRIKTSEFENSGQIATGGRTEIEAQTAKLDNGSIITGRDLVLAGSHYKMRNANLDVSAKLFLDIDGTFTDGGSSANNNIIVRNGINMLSSPQSANLLGTYIISEIPRFGNVQHIWRGEDLGKSSAGFKDNAAIGTLEITGPAGTRANFTASRAKSGTLCRFPTVRGFIYRILEGHHQN
jgi:hypothetical protein